MKSLTETGRTSGLWAVIGLGCSARASRTCAPQPASEPKSARGKSTRMPGLWPIGTPGALPAARGRIPIRLILGAGHLGGGSRNGEEAHLLVRARPAVVLDEHA